VGFQWRLRRGTEHKLHAQPSLRTACRRVVLDRDTTLAPNSESIVSGKVMFQGCIRPTNDKNWTTCTNQLSPGVSVAQVLIPDRLTDIPLRILNVNSEPVLLTAGDVITELTAVEVCDTNRDTNETKIGATQLKAIDKIIANMEETVSEAEPDKFRKLLRECSTVFAFEENEIGRTSATRHEIDTGDARPVR